MSAYKVMWLMVNFDLPTDTKVEVRRANNFRNMLKKEGFFMKQFSMYMMWFPNKTQADVMASKIGSQVPKKCNVSITPITDRQYGLTKNYVGLQQADIEKPQEQLMLF